MSEIRDKINAHPGKPAYIMDKTGEVVTRIELEERSNQCAHLFRSLGLSIGDHIAILMENNRYFFEICSAASRSGVIYTPVSTYLKESEVEYIVNNCEAKLFISSIGKRDIAAFLIDKIPNVENCLMVGSTIDGCISYEEKITQFATTPIADEMAGQDMLYSSGTTGRPKGVKVNYKPMPYGDIPAAGKALIMLYRFNEDTIYLSPAPLYHAAPLRFCLLVLYAGGTVIVMDHFDAQRSLQLIDKYKATHSQWVPTMFIRMLKLPETERAKYDVSSMTIAIHAAAPIPITVKEQMIKWWGPVIMEYYAGTEANGITIINSNQWMTHKGSVGRALVGVVHILDEQGNELPPGEPGLIYFGDGPEFEYHDDPEKTISSRSLQGWSTLGDIGYLDEKGYLYLTDRKANMIISGGVNIYPQETENVLVMHPKVLDAAVIGVPHEEFGEEVKGIIQLRDHAEAGPKMEQELMEFCKSKISRIKCPVSIDFIEELPRTATGKLLKRLLKEKYWPKDKLI